MVKADGAVLVHADAGGYKPLNWMTPPTVLEEEPGRIVVRKRAGKTEDRLEIRLTRSSATSSTRWARRRRSRRRASSATSSCSWPSGRTRSASRSGSSSASGRPTSARSTSCAATTDGSWVAVEIKRVATIEAVEQLSRYLERIRLDPARSLCRGVLAAQSVKPQAATLAEARGFRCVEVDLELLRGGREPDLTLFAL